VVAEGIRKAMPRGCLAAYGPDAAAEEALAGVDLADTAEAAHDVLERYQAFVGRCEGKT
jgi:hypothetical protein